MEMTCFFAFITLCLLATGLILFHPAILIWAAIGFLTTVFTAVIEQG